MYSPTYGELKNNLQMELDLQNENFITDDEYLSYFNEGVDLVESTIHTIYEDYFLTSDSITLVSGTDLYNMPADIYAQKIRGLFYNDNAANIYEIKRIKQLKDTLTFDPSTTGTNIYMYLTTNGSAGIKIKFFPVPRENSTFITRWYLRNAKRFTADNDVCDIPEFSMVITQYAKWKCMMKEGHPDANAAGQILQGMKQEMVETLTAKIPDEDNKIPLDTSFYNDFDTGGWGDIYGS